MPSLSLAELTGQNPDQPAVRDDFQTLSWGELDRQIAALGHGLKALKLKELDHVAIIISNRIEFLQSYLATIAASFTQTPIKTNWSVDQMVYLLKDANSKAVITDNPNGRLAAQSLGLPIIDIENDFVGWLDTQIQDPLPSGGRGYRIPYTSGTTGFPKGVWRVQDVSLGFEDWARQLAVGSEALHLPSSGWHLMVSQMFHGAPMTFGIGAFFSGAPMRIVNKWDQTHFADLLLEGVTATIMVPTMFRQLLALPESEREKIDPSNLQAVLHGGEGCPVALKQQMIDWWGPVFYEYYGFTEGGMTFATSQEWLKKLGTVGLPIGNMEILVIDENQNTLDANEVGQLYFRRPEGAFFKYINDEEKTSAAYLENGAFGVGDIGYVDEDGYLFISGRTAELIVSSGVNIYPAEIEAVLLEVNGVANAAVVAGPDSVRGEQPVAFLVVAQGWDPEQVISAAQNLCQEKLAGNMFPRQIHLRDEIPRDPTGKTLRGVLREELWSQA